MMFALHNPEIRRTVRPTLLVLGMCFAGTWGSGLRAQALPGSAALQKPSAVLPVAEPSTLRAAAAFPTPRLQQPPSQAVIQSAPNSLTIKADNASLTQTLQRIAETTGMHLEGISGDERVFGSFGPGAPRDVLAALLNGTSYNLIMVGSLENGVPKQLLLSAKSTNAAPKEAPAASPQPADDDTAEVPQQEDPPQAIPPPGRPIIGQGMNGPHNPQDMLQQLRQQQMQQTQSGEPQ